MRGPSPLGILLELDGVLVDTRTARRASLTAAFAAEDLAWPAIAPDQLDGKSLEEVVRTVAAAYTPPPDATTLALVALRADREYAAHINTGVTLVAGAHEAVAALGATFRLGVVTAWRRADAQRTLALADLDAAVRFIVAADDGVACADPAGRFARGVARLRGVLPDLPVAAIVAGESGATAARAAGAQPVRVPEQIRLHDLTPGWLTAALDRPTPPPPY